MTALDNWIAQLLQFAKSATGFVEPLNSDIQGVVIPALQSLNTGGNPVFNSLTVQSATGTIPVPAAGQGVAGSSAANGLVLLGRGSANDVVIENNAGTPALSLATGTTNFSAAGAFAVTGKLSGAGTNTNDNASAGQIGEYVVATLGSGSAVSLTTGTTFNVTSISLTAGDWEVTCNAEYTGGATTTVTQLIGGISLVSAALPTDGTTARYLQTFPGGPTLFAINGYILDSGPVRVSINATTTVFLVAQASFGVSTCSVYGQIQARRMR